MGVTCSSESSSGDVCPFTSDLKVGRHKVKLGGNYEVHEQQQQQQQQTKTCPFAGQKKEVIFASILVSPWHAFPAWCDPHARMSKEDGDLIRKSWQMMLDDTRNMRSVLDEAEYRQIFHQSQNEVSRTTKTRQEESANENSKANNSCVQSHVDQDGEEDELQQHEEPEDTVANALLATNDSTDGRNIAEKTANQDSPTKPRKHSFDRQDDSPGLDEPNSSSHSKEVMVTNHAATTTGVDKQTSDGASEKDHPLAPLPHPSALRVSLENNSTTSSGENGNISRLDGSRSTLTTAPSSSPIASPTEVTDSDRSSDSSHDQKGLNSVVSIQMLSLSPQSQTPTEELHRHSTLAPIDSNHRRMASSPNPVPVRSITVTAPTRQHSDETNAASSQAGAVASSSSADKPLASPVRPTAITRSASLDQRPRSSTATTGTASNTNTNGTASALVRAPSLTNTNTVDNSQRRGRRFQSMNTGKKTTQSNPIGVVVLSTNATTVTTPSGAPSTGPASSSVASSVNPASHPDARSSGMSSTLSVQTTHAPRVGSAASRLSRSVAPREKAHGSVVSQSGVKSTTYLTAVKKSNTVVVYELLIRAWKQTDPSIALMWKNIKMAIDVISRMIGFFVKYCDQLDAPEVQVILKRIVDKHVVAKVAVKSYELLMQALLLTLKKVLGKDFSYQVNQAWIKAFSCFFVVALPMHPPEQQIFLPAMSPRTYAKSIQQKDN